TAVAKHKRRLQSPLGDLIGGEHSLRTRQLDDLGGLFWPRHRLGNQVHLTELDATPFSPAADKRPFVAYKHKTIANERRRNIVHVDAAVAQIFQYLPHLSMHSGFGCRRTRSCPHE